MEMNEKNMTLCYKGDKVEKVYRGDLAQMLSQAFADGANFAEKHISGGRTEIAVDELKEYVRQKLESIRATSPGEGWEEYYRGRLSAFEEVEAVINSLEG